MALAAAAIAAILSTFMSGIFAQPVDIPGSAYMVLPLSALIVGLVASLAALRRAASVDPAVAFAGADGRARGTRPDGGVRLGGLRGAPPQ